MDRVVEMIILSTCEGFYGYEEAILYDVQMTIEEAGSIWTETPLMILSDLREIEERNNICAISHINK